MHRPWLRCRFVRRSIRFAALTATAVAVGAAAPASAQFEIVEVERSVAWLFGVIVGDEDPIVVDEDSIESTDFGDFSHTVSASPTYQRTSGTVGGDVRSRMDTYFVEWSSVTSASAIGDGSTIPPTNAISASQAGLGLTFMLDEPGRVRLDLLQSSVAGAEVFAGSFLFLNGPGINLKYGGEDGPLVLDGVFAAGTYTLQVFTGVQALAEPNPASGISHLDLQLILGEGELPPVAGDANGDRWVDFADVLTVIANFGPCPGCPEDLNGDGFVGFADLLEVLANWT